MTLNLFHGTGLFLCSLKISGNLWFSDVFQRVQKETSTMKWFKDIFNKYVSRILIFIFFHNEACFFVVICTGSCNTLRRSKASVFSILSWFQGLRYTSQRLLLVDDQVNQLKQETVFIIAYILKRLVETINLFHYSIYFKLIKTTGLMYS